VTVTELEVRAACRLGLPLSSYRALGVDDRAAVESLIVVESLKQTDKQRRRKREQEITNKQQEDRDNMRAKAPKLARR